MPDAVDSALEEMDRLVRRSIIDDASLHSLLRAEFATDETAKTFVAKCLRKSKTRHALLILQWYCEIAEGMDLVKHRPPLRLIFLMSAAEGVASVRFPTIEQSWPRTQKFFGAMSTSDKYILNTKIRRALLSVRHHNLRLLSIIKILYQVRNDAVHGQDFWRFNLPRRDEVEPGVSMLTEGKIGKRGRKKRLTLDVSIHFEDLRDIIVRTGLAHIKAMF